MSYTIYMNIMFCGHSRLPDKETVSAELERSLIAIFMQARREGIKLEFLCGGYGDFDLLSAITVNNIKKRFNSVESSIYFITPYITQSYKQRINQVLTIFVGIIYPLIESVPYRFAINKRNEWMVKNSDIVIAYVKYSWGGAARTLEYAKKKNKFIIMI